MPPRALMYWFYAKAYGWTQHQVDEDISLEMYEWYPKIEQAESETAAIKQKQAQRTTRQQSRPF